MEMYELVVFNMLFKNRPCGVFSAAGIAANMMKRKMPGICFHRESLVFHMFTHRLFKSDKLQASASDTRSTIDLQ